MSNAHNVVIIPFTNVAIKHAIALPHAKRSVVAMTKHTDAHHTDAARAARHMAWRLRAIDNGAAVV